MPYVIRAVDVLGQSQPFEEICSVQIPDSLLKGYIAITVFDSNQLILAHQNSGFWPKRKILESSNTK